MDITIMIYLTDIQKSQPVIQVHDCTHEQYISILFTCLHAPIILTLNRPLIDIYSFCFIIKHDMEMITIEMDLSITFFISTLGYYI